MAAAAGPPDDNSDLDDHHLSPRASPDSRRNGGSRPIKQRVHPHSANLPSPLQTKGGLGEDDDGDVSPESDISIPEPAPAPPSQRHPAMPAAPAPPPSSRSPVRQKPPVTNTRDTWGAAAPPQSRARPSSVSGPSVPDDGRRNSASMSNGRYRHHDRPNGRPPSQGHPHAPSSGQWPRTREPSSSKQSSSQNRRSHPSAQDPRLRAPSPSSPVKDKIPVNRLESPSIAKSVLQPLEQKIFEYERLMGETQDEMAQLDEEIRLLSERRRQTEEKYLDAKAKHDDYDRQHQDVERALRGDLASPAPPQQHYPQQMMAQLPRDNPTVESFGGRPNSIPASKQSSRTRKMGTRDRIKMSLFGSL